MIRRTLIALAFLTPFMLACDAGPTEPQLEPPVAMDSWDGIDEDFQVYHARIDRIWGENNVEVTIAATAPIGNFSVNLSSYLGEGDNAFGMCQGNGMGLAWATCIVEMMPSACPWWKHDYQMSQVFGIAVEASGQNGSWYYGFDQYNTTDSATCPKITYV